MEQYEYVVVNLRFNPWNGKAKADYYLGQKSPSYNFDSVLNAHLFEKELWCKMHLEGCQIVGST